MISEYKIILGVVASIVGIIGYIPYYRDILRGTTKPHPFTWIGFALLLGIAFFVQLEAGAGPGAWVSGISVIGVLGIAALSIFEGEKNITTFDWICFGGALVGIVLWRAAHDPRSAIIIVTVVDTIAFLPTYRKAYLKPFEETASLFVWATLKYVISLFALATLSLTTALFPAAIAVSNIIFVAMVLVRRRQMSIAIR